MINIHISTDELAFMQEHQEEVNTYLDAISEATIAAELACMFGAKRAYNIIDTIRTHKMADLCIMHFKLGQMFNEQD